MKRFKILIALTLLSGAMQLKAQTFKAYIAAGVNVTGDNLTELGNRQQGTRQGINIGPGVSTILNDRWEASLELLYSQNGFYTNPTQFPAITLNEIQLHYVEVPITISYRFNIKKHKQASLYKRRISGGINYARLFNHQLIALDGRDLTNEHRFDQENGLLFHIGATSFFKESFGLNIRGTLSTFGEWTMALRFLYYL